MTATVRIQHIATGAPAIVVEVLQVQSEGLPRTIASHTLRGGDTHNVRIDDGQRIVVIEPAPPFAHQLEAYRATLPPRAPGNEPTDADIEAAANG